MGTAMALLVGRVGLEPKTYGLEEDSGESPTSQNDCKKGFICTEDH